MTTTTLDPIAPASPSTAAGTARLNSIDIVRGVVMILMAIDHVRVYSGVPAGGPSPGVFFTRWVTHFCAPAFVFLAGTAMYLHGTRLSTKGELSRFLVTRGLWLVFLELTFLRVTWTFNLQYNVYLLAGVIWVIGVCMLLMAGIIHLPVKAIAAFGVAVMALHQLIGLVATESMAGNWAGKLLYFGDAVGSAPSFVVLYTVIPWIGVMAAGYAFGAVMKLPADRRRSLCITIGCTAIALFAALRFVDVYGDPRSWREGPAPAFIDFLNTSKYPASLLFLLMTLGPTILAIGLLDRARGRFADILATYGRVPLFYYLLHIPLIHLAALAVSKVRTGAVDPWLFTNHPMWPGQLPDGYRWSLSLLYLVTAIVVVLLYLPCRWFARVKQEQRDRKWLSYL